MMGDVQLNSNLDEDISDPTCNSKGIVNVTEAEAMTSMWSTNENIFLTFVIPVLGVFGIAANLIFLATIIRRKELHNNLCMHLINLGVCDIILLSTATYWVTSMHRNSPIRFSWLVDNTA